MAYLALALSAVGALESLVRPGIVIWVYLYPAFHGGQGPSNLP